MSACHCHTFRALCSIKALLLLVSCRNLRLNSITGAIPDSFSSLSNLKILDLSDNFLTGTLPGSLSTHGALSSLHLSDNQLTGLAGFSGSSLANVMINNNAFSGMAISQLSILQRLTANNNQMKGPLPNFSAATSLQIFNAANNSLYVVHVSIDGGYSLFLTPCLVIVVFASIVLAHYSI